MYLTIGIIFGILLVILIAVLIFINQPKFGKLPSGERLERVKQSPNYRDGNFQNQNPAQQLTSGKSFIGTAWGFLFDKPDSLRPDEPVEVVKTDLHDIDGDALVWFGHSSYLMQLENKIFVSDLVLYDAAPVSFVNKAFDATYVYKAEDMPYIDYFIATHDHWDHLDHRTFKALKDRIGYVICPLGVGAHFERWGFDADRIIELDWYEHSELNNGFAVHCLPARHFSGRGLKRNQTLWASFLIRSSDKQIYIGGDGGYDTHFAEIGSMFPEIDLAVLENGQYNEAWKHIHTMPSYLEQVALDLRAKSILTVHHSKYSLSTHEWTAPLMNAESISETGNVNVLMPKIGEVLDI